MHGSQIYSQEINAQKEFSDHYSFRKISTYSDVISHNLNVEVF